MSNIPQDVIDDAVAAGLAVENHGGLFVWYSKPSNITDRIVKFAQLRAQRSNAEPVAIVTVGSQDHGPFSYRETAYGIDHLPDGESKLYTAPPDYAAGVAAGMMKAAEIIRSKVDPDKTQISEQWNGICNDFANEILSAIPADSKAALRERDRALCMEVADVVADYFDAAEYHQEALNDIVNDVLEGKS